jgi:hypothetical protein
VYPAEADQTADTEALGEAAPSEDRADTTPVEV